MTTHVLKAHPDTYAAIAAGRPFDLRFDDRGYEVGDTLVLKEYDPDPARAMRRLTVPDETLSDGIFDRQPGRVAKSFYTGQEITRRVTSLLRGGGEAQARFGLLAEYVVLGLGEEKT
jgi:hypothetical protein